MKKISTAAANEVRNISHEKLTIGLDLGDRSSWYCVLDESGAVLLEQRVSTTPKAMREVFGGMPRSRIALETYWELQRDQMVQKPPGLATQCIWNSKRSNSKNSIRGRSCMKTSLT